MSPVGFELITSRSSVPCSADCAKSLFGCGCEPSKAFIKSCSIDSRNKQSPICEMVHETKESSLQTSPTDSSLAQWGEHGTEDLEVVSSIKPLWGRFLMKYILYCVTLDLSDNLTEMRLKGLTWKTQLSYHTIRWLLK